MNAEATLYQLILATPSITALLTSAAGSPAVSVGVREPTTWKRNYKTISIYNAVGVDDSEQPLLTDLTCNCRAGREDQAKAIAAALVATVNRYRIPEGKGQFYTFTGPVIIPEDETDSYNIPVTVTVKAVKDLE